MDASHPGRDGLRFAFERSCMPKVLIVAGYLAALLVLGLLARRRAKPGHEDFFLASRSLGPLILFLTMAATNFSSFTVFGFAGAGYRIGYAYYPIMAFGTGFMALSFLFIGIPVWRYGVKTGAITPTEIIWHRFRNRPLHLVYLAVMMVFTLPYLALQPMGAGYALKGLLGLPYVWGAVIVVVVGVGYVLLAGLRGDAWTDVLQGFVMLAAMLAVFFGVAQALGGLSAANAQVASRWPELLTRPGGGGQFTYGIWFSYMALWLLCDPMFPQLFQRFLAAKNERALRVTTLLYPLITGLLFFLPVAVGVMGRTVFPDLAAKASDQVLPMVVAKLLPGWLGALAMAGGLAALMSTMDSQLLTLSSMFVRDVSSAATGRPAQPAWLRNLVIVVLAGAGLALAVRPLGTLLEIATETFTGLAVLFPVTVAGIYWKRTNPWAGLGSIVAGEALVVLYHFKLLPAFGLLPAIPVVLVSAIVLVVGSLVRPARGLEPLTSLPKGWWRWFALSGLVFGLAHDFWWWRDARPGPFGLPVWLWYHFGLIVVLFVLFWVLAAAGKPEEQKDRVGDADHTQHQPERERVTL